VSLVIRRNLLLPVALLALGATADAGGLDLRLGWYFPSTDSNLFADVSSLYTKGAAFGQTSPPGIQESDWDSFMGGIEYNHKVANYIELAVSVDGYGKTLDTSYRDYVRQDDSPIQQTLRLSVVPIGLSVRLVPTSRSARLAPFVVAGVDAMVYEYEEFGDFVDFFTPGQEIIPDSFKSSGVGFGFHAGGGLRVSVSDDFAIVGEARYFWSKTQMDEDFSQNEIDLGGLSATIGFRVRF
jgi:hypothetical protein